MVLDKQLYYRLVALWIFCEAVLGGIIHGLKLPVSGLIVGSCSVICICLIACYVPLRNAILKATILVAIFKLMLSPHSPPTAYIAVFFQGLIGQLLFSTNGFSKTSCILLGVIALAESALQRILVMTIVFGNDLWKAINDTINKLTGQGGATNYSLLFGVGYLLLHIIVGFIVGLIAYKLATQQKQPGAIYLIPDETNETVNIKPKKKKLKMALLITWIIFLILFLQSWLSIGKPILPSHVFFQIILRSLFIMLTWYFVVSPILLYFTRKWLEKQQKKTYKRYPGCSPTSSSYPTYDLQKLGIVLLRKRPFPNKKMSPNYYHEHVVPS